MILKILILLLLYTSKMTTVDRTMRRYIINCTNPIKHLPCVKSYQNVATYYRINMRYKLNFCAIQKNLSTVLKAIACYLDNPKLQNSNQTLISHYWIKKICGNRNRIGSLKNEARWYGDGNIENFLKTYKGIVIVRNPIERFISAFADKCVIRYKESEGRCYGCFNNLTCFINTLYKRLLNQVVHNNNTYNFTYVDRHFYPQTWYCQLNEYHKMYKIFKINPERKISVNKFYQSFTSYLSSKGVSFNETTFIKNAGQSKYTGHSTFHTKSRKIVKKELLKNKILMDKLIRIYYYDFTTFNFKFPKKGKRFYI
uniref:Sulfotransfer_1 domain-containing protein n=1 Tax=Parastrongyloides trichosuri TaxID=131310 RepID=A0A0N4Z3K3_PARTI